jgi:3,4-dehydroadipyl-CoA semialdehyde dehydrogenase
VQPQDVVAFTGSGDTGATIRALPSIVRHNVRLNLEADSLNAAILGPDVEPSSETYSLFLKDVVRDITQKAGQKCTAIRRILVPRDSLAQIRDELVARLERTVVGNPAEEGVRMGPLATASQQRDVRGGIAALAADGRLVLGAGPFTPVGVPAGKGFFVPISLLEVAEGSAAPSVHSLEVFGPVSTLIPYSGDPSEAASLVARGAGCLVSSVYSDDQPFTTSVTLGLAPFHGRLFLGSEKIAEQSPGPGTVLPLLVHGGPGRAGGGEELGGLRGLSFYMQRVALEGSRPVIEKILNG